MQLTFPAAEWGGGCYSQHRTLPKFVWGCNVTHLIHYLLPKMGRLAPEVTYQIRVRIKASKEVPAIAKAINVSRPTVYKIWLNLNLYPFQQ